MSLLYESIYNKRVMEAGATLYNIETFYMIEWSIIHKCHMLPPLPFVFCQCEYYTVVLFDGEQFKQTKNRWPI